MTKGVEKLGQLPKLVPDLSGHDPVVKRISDQESNQYEHQKQELELAGGRYELEARKRFGTWIFVLVAMWIAAVMVIVILAGYSETKIFGEVPGPKVPDGVLIALISGMSVNVIGLLAIVINYLFPKRPN